MELGLEVLLVGFLGLVLVLRQEIQPMALWVALQLERLFKLRAVLELPLKELPLRVEALLAVQRWSLGARLAVARLVRLAEAPLVAQLVQLALAPLESRSSQAPLAAQPSQAPPKPQPSHPQLAAQRSP